MSASPERHARAQSLAPYFALQLRLAEEMAGRTGVSMAEAVTQYTNLHRRFGLGSVGDAPPSPRWLAYGAGLDARDSAEARLDWTLACFAAAPEKASSSRVFGCFAFDPPQSHGVVRIHFENRDPDKDIGPLNRARLSRRLDDLRRMFAHIREAHPEATSVMGASWLYNLEAYRRLFPPAYGASRFAPESLNLRGSSSWGQLLDHRGGVKPDMRDRFLANLPDLDPEAPWRVFPLHALAVSAPIGLFFDHYGLDVTRA